jgi:hypothetical protein
LIGGCAEGYAGNEVRIAGGPRKVRGVDDFDVVCDNPLSGVHRIHRRITVEAVYQIAGFVAEMFFDERCALERTGEVGVELNRPLSDIDALSSGTLNRFPG